ncbi:MAG: DegT/DnrJ/EryC1/StrS family aminotransferase [Trebonia sp.]
MTSALALLGGTPVRTRPWPAWPVSGQAETDAAARVLASGRWGGIVPGGECAALEERLAGYLGAPHVVTISSGTSGLIAALLAAGIGPEDEVIVPAMTYIATATAVTWCRAVPVFADIDPATHTLDPAAAAAAVTSRTRAVIAVHLGGHPADTDALAALASERGIILIEDCAQSLGATWDGAHTGLAGAIGVLSFAATKNITAGEGGAIITRDPLLARRAAALRDHGRAPGAVGHQTLGGNLRLTEIQAAILSAQLTRLDGHLATKEQAAVWIARELGGIPGVQPVPAARDPRVTQHARSAYALCLDPAAWPGVPAGAVRAALRAEGLPAVTRPVIAVPDEPLYASPPGPGHPGSRTASASRARQACASIVILGQPAGAALLLAGHGDLADVPRAVAKVASHVGDLRGYCLQWS